MAKVSEALERRNITGEGRTDIYNRAYEAVYQAIKDMEQGAEEKHENLPSV